MTAVALSAALVAVVVAVTGFPLGVWTRPRRPPRHREDRQLLDLIRHERRNTR